MKHIAAIITEYWPRSHADVIVGKFLRGFPCDEGLLPPRVKIVSMYLDHVVAEDTGVETAARFGVPIYPSVLQALTLGTDKLAVDGVLIVGEHGQYPLNERGQKLYPRKHLFEQVAGVISTAEKPVPVFTDKHLSYNWTDAKWMYDRAKALGIPLMAGSSLPVAWRRPQLQHPLGTKIGRAALVGYGGTESYGFHTLEALQCMVERRAGGESGVASVQCLSGGEVWSWLDAHPTDAELVESAGLAIAETECAWDEIRDHVSEPHAFLLHYRDGLEATALMLNGYCRSWAYAADVEGDVQSCEVVLQTGGAHGHFSYLSLNAEEMMVTGKASYPVERTLLTSGVLDACMASRYRGGQKLETAYLDVSYQPVSEPPFRALGASPSGATLDFWPPEGEG